MNLELVMLATVFSMITERPVEAQLWCYENKDFTGKNATINNSMPDLTGLFPNGPNSCKVTAKSVLIFYSGREYRGKIHTVNVDDTEVFSTPFFRAKSVLMLGNSKNDEGLFLFQEKDFQRGVFQSFNLETKNVRGNITFKSAVVLGLDWTVVRRCDLNDFNGPCFVCLKRAKSGASFIFRINSTGMWETEAIFPGDCSGTNHTGVSSITALNCKVETYQVGNKCEKCGCMREGKRWMTYPSGFYNHVSGCSSTGQCPCDVHFGGKQCDIPNYARYVRDGEACYSCTVTKVEGANATFGCSRDKTKIGCKDTLTDGKKGYICHCYQDNCHRKNAKYFETASYRPKYPRRDA